MFVKGRKGRLEMFLYLGLGQPGKSPENSQEARGRQFFFDPLNIWKGARPRHKFFKGGKISSVNQDPSHFMVEYMPRGMPFDIFLSRHCFVGIYFQFAHFSATNCGLSYFPCHCLPLVLFSSQLHVHRLSSHENISLPCSSMHKNCGSHFLATIFSDLAQHLGPFPARIPSCIMPFPVYYYLAADNIFPYIFSAAIQARQVFRQEKKLHLRPA